MNSPKVVFRRRASQGSVPLGFYIGDNIAGREWKDENGNVLAGNEKDMAVLAKAGAAFAYGGMQSLLMSMGGAIAGRKAEPAASQGLQASDARLPDGAAEKQKSDVGSQKSSLQAARQKAAAAMVLGPRGAG